MGKIEKIIKNPWQYTIIAFGRILPDTISADAFYLRLLYHNRMKRKLNLDNPQTFNEKIQWLKLYDRNPIYTTMVDKYEVKKYVAEKIGEEYIIPTLGVWDRFDDIDFDVLPNQFVLKTTHDSGGIYICNNKEKFDGGKAKKIIEHSLKRKYYLNTREWPYKNVKPRIIAEQYMVDEFRTSNELLDYKLMCFDGKVRCSFVCSDRYSDGLKVTFYDNNWNMLPFERHYPKSDAPIPKPRNFEKMIRLAEILSKDIPFVRTDFYEINENVYFGELTFYPGSGMEEFTPESADYKMGSFIKLPASKSTTGHK